MECSFHLTMHYFTIEAKLESIARKPFTVFLFFHFLRSPIITVNHGENSPVPDFDLFLLNCSAARSCSDAFECCAHNRRSLQVRISGPFQTSRPLRRAFFWVFVFLRAVLPFYSFSFPVSANPTTIPPNVHFDMAFKLVLLRLSLRAISNTQNAKLSRRTLSLSFQDGWNFCFIKGNDLFGCTGKGRRKTKKMKKKNTSEAFRKVDEINDFRINFKF